MTQPAVAATDANLPAYQVVLLGTITGLVLGILAALALDRLEYRVDEREIAERLDCRTLGRITAGDDADATRAVALSLDEVAASALARVIAVVGAGDRQPAARAAARIAIGLAETGRRVILIDANLRHPTLHEAFVVAPTPGLAEVIGDEVYDVGSALQPIRLTAGANGTLQLLATGNAGGSDPALMLASTSFREALDVIEPLADYTVLAAGDVTATADARLTARRAHGIVVAVTDPGTRPRELDQVLARLETGRAPVLGAVLVEAGAPILTAP